MVAWMIHENSARPQTEWHPFKPGFLNRRTVAKQIGHKDWSHVMRRKYQGKWQYRACTPKEIASIDDMIERANRIKKLQRSR